MAPICIFSGFVGILCGGLLLLSGLGLHWFGAGMLLVGAFSMALGTGTLRLDRPWTPEPADREPWTAEDFYNPNVVLPPPGAISIHCLPTHIDADPNSEHLVVGYGDYRSPVPITPDPWQQIRGDLLALALSACPGAETLEPKVVGYENGTGLFEDDFNRFECRVRVTPANVLALRATRFAWTAAAEGVAGSVELTSEEVEAVWQRMAELAEENYRSIMAEMHGFPGENEEPST